MNVLILEKNANDAQKIEKQMHAVFDVLKLTICHQICKAVEAIDKERFDIISLAIHLPDGDGLEIAKLIRRSSYNRSAYLLMIGEDDSLTSGFLAYDEARCFKFLNRPLDEAKLFDALLEIHSAYKEKSPTYFVHKNRQMMINMPIHHILYFEINYKTCHLQTWSDSININRYPLKAVLENVPASDFIQVHRSFVVNKRNILKVALIDKTWHCFFFNHTHTVPIGKKFFPVVKALMTSK